MEYREYYGGHKLLVANRGEIAVRVIRTAKRLGISTVAVYSTSDALSPHVSLADEAALLKDGAQVPDGQQLESKLYLSLFAIVAVCKDRHVTMVHPGYGFLSENADFARAVLDAGMIWLGPQPDVIRTMGLKHEARSLAVKAGLPLVPGSQGLVDTPEDALKIAREIGFPIVLKATAGGGGMGLTVCKDGTELSVRFRNATERAEALFHHDGVFIERYFPSARHIEVQVFGNGIGDVIHMGERECSVQRRHQKVIEETPSPFFSRYPNLRKEMCDAAVRLCRSVKYSSAGTVEFLVDDEAGHFFFLEMNTRIQGSSKTIPERKAIHPGLDIVELMIAQGVVERAPIRGLNLDSLTLSQSVFDTNLDINATHAIEVRIYSENPADEFRPCSGVLQQVDLPEQDWLRVDHWISAGTNITTFFDPLLCKLIVKGDTREKAVFRLQQALSTCKIRGPPNNTPYLRAICESETFKDGRATTTFLDTFEYTPRAFTVVSGGIEVTIQDLPGRRIGLGMPQSGPMDIQAFQAANIIAGNNPETEGLEIVTLPGVECKFIFHVPCVVAVTGKAISVKINRERVPMWARLVVPAKGTLEIGSEPSNGFRVYFAARGGFPEVPRYLGSKSTSMGLGGYQGRALKRGDLIALSDCSPNPYEIQNTISFVLPTTLAPVYPKEWTVNVLPGPHDDDEFLTPEGNTSFYSTQWTISSSSNRMGIRLQSNNRIQWSRADGGEGGSHPSNILDNGYALGAVNLNGDTPVILTQEGPDMGGYVCVCTVTSGDLWKLGQLSPGSTVTFKRISWAEAQIGARAARLWAEDVQSAVWGDAIPTRAALSLESESRHFSPILQKIVPPAGSPRAAVTFRQAGDSAILVEYGQMKLDFHLRARVHALETQARSRKVDGIWSFAPCIRSTMCRFDPTIISQNDVLNFLIEAENSLPDTMTDIEFPGRKIVFPIALDDRWNREALEKYMNTTRSKAVYLPSNIDYLARNNGLRGGATDALEKLIGSNWLVFGVGFYLACPFLVPVDPRCRLVGQKMNPSRTYTPSGAVGIAGPVAAIYPVVSPGGYQLFGRTLPAWQTWGIGADFSPERPWLLQPFDQVSFRPVSEERYLEIEQEFNAGRYTFEIEPTVFSMAAYTRFVTAVANEVAEFTERQTQAVAHEGARENELLHEWLAQQELETSGGDTGSSVAMETLGYACIPSSMSASVWKIKCQVGQEIELPDEVMVVLEAMKTEINVTAGEENVGRTVRGLGKGIREGASVQAGDVWVWVS